MKCLSCFNEITEEYKLCWQALPYCSKCSIVVINNYFEFKRLIHYILNRNFIVKTYHDKLVYNDVELNLLKLFDLNKILSTQKICHLTCVEASHVGSVCKFLSYKTEHFTIYQCPINDAIMFHPDEITNIIEKQIEISNKKHFFLKKLIHKLWRRNDYI